MRIRGFSLVEMTLSLAIMALIFAIGTYAFVGANRKGGLNTLADSVVATLEKAKANAMSGYNGHSFGVHVGTTAGTTSYIYFEGSSYDPASPTNVTIAVPKPYTFFATTTPGVNTIIFARLSGIPNATSTITVRDPNDPTHPQIISVGSLGDISITRQ